MAPQQPAAAASSILGRLTNHCGVRVTLVDQRSLSIHPKAPETAEISTSNAEWIWSKLGDTPHDVQTKNAPQPFSEHSAILGKKQSAKTDVSFRCTDSVRWGFLISGIQSMSSDTAAASARRKTKVCSFGMRSVGGYHEATKNCAEHRKMWLAPNKSWGIEVLYINIFI